MTALMAQVLTSVTHKKLAYPSDEFLIELPMGVTVAFQSVFQISGMSTVQLRVNSPCCNDSVVAREPASPTASYFSKGWSCSSCLTVFGDEHWRVTLTRSLEAETPVWAVNDMGVLEKLVNESYQVFDAAMVHLDLIALFEEIVNWLTVRHGTVSDGELLIEAHNYFGGREVWTPQAT